MERVKACAGGHTAHWSGLELRTPRPVDSSSDRVSCLDAGPPVSLVVGGSCPFYSGSRHRQGGPCISPERTAVVGSYVETLVITLETTARMSQRTVLLSEK